MNSFNPSFPPDALFSQQVLPPFTCPYGVHALLHLWPLLLQAVHRLVGEKNSRGGRQEIDKIRTLEGKEKCRWRDKGGGYVVKRQGCGTRKA